LRSRVRTSAFHWGTSNGYGIPCVPAAAGPIDPGSGSHCHLLYNQRREEAQVNNYAEEPTLKYLIAILKDAKKTGAGR
jgi:hypothetical protein